MPFFSPKRKVSDAENKLRVLMCLDGLGMATQEQLWPFVAQLELMEYIPFCMFVDELLSDGVIAAGTHAMEGCLFLTPAGRQQLELFSRKMAHADRQRIAAEAPGYARRLSESRQVRAAYVLAPQGGYSAVGTVCEGDIHAMRLQVHSADGKTIEKFVSQFSSLAAQMLARLYTLPPAADAGEVPKALPQEEALQSVSDNCPVLCTYGGREHAAVVCFGNEQLAFTLLLLLPSADVAWSWAKTASERGEELANGFAALIEAQP